MTHHCQRHGTTILFAALDVASGTILHDCMPRHRHQGFLRFIRGVERSVPRGLGGHVILDNYQTHKHPTVRVWLAQHPRLHIHFTPTSASWLNLVERFFAELTERQLRRLAVTSVAELVAAMFAYIDRRNVTPTPFVWTARVTHILAKVRKAQATLATVAPAPNCPTPCSMPRSTSSSRIRLRWETESRCSPPSPVCGGRGSTDTMLFMRSAASSPVTLRPGAGPGTERRPERGVLPAPRVAGGQGMARACRVIAAIDPAPGTRLPRPAGPRPYPVRASASARRACVPTSSHSWADTSTGRIRYPRRAKSRYSVRMGNRPISSHRSNTAGSTT